MLQETFGETGMLEDHAAFITQAISSHAIHATYTYPCHTWIPMPRPETYAMTYTHDLCHDLCHDLPQPQTQPSSYLHQSLESTRA